MKIILGVGGGIAAYKSAELARLLMQEGHAGPGRHDPRRAGVHQPPDLRRPHRAQDAHRSVRHRERHRAHCRGAGKRADGHCSGHRGPDRQAGPWPGGRFPHHALPGLHRPGGAGALDELEHVAAPGHPGQPRNAAPARPPHRGTGERLPGVRHDRPRPAGGSGSHRGSHSSANRAGAATWKAKPCSSPPVPPRSRSTRCATSPTVPAARWAMRWPKPRPPAARASS